LLKDTTVKELKERIINELNKLKIINNSEDYKFFCCDVINQKPGKRIPLIKDDIEIRNIKQTEYTFYNILVEIQTNEVNIQQSMNGNNNLNIY
jgi:hypothetical protein